MGQFAAVIVPQYCGAGMSIPLKAMQEAEPTVGWLGAAHCGVPAHGLGAGIKLTTSTMARVPAPKAAWSSVCKRAWVRWGQVQHCPHLPRV